MVGADDTVTSISFTARQDVAEAQIADTAHRVSQYYKVLLSSGLSVEAATNMTDLFNALLLHHHFDVEYKSGGDNFLSFLGEG